MARLLQAPEDLARLGQLRGDAEGRARANQAALGAALGAGLGAQAGGCVSEAGSGGAWEGARRRAASGERRPLASDRRSAAA